MGGAVETLGVVGRYQPGFNVGLGFDGITIAMLGKTHPFGAIPAAMLVGAMKAGASEMQFSSGVAKEITDVIQALILFFVAADVIVRTLLRIRELAAKRSSSAPAGVNSEGAAMRTQSPTSPPGSVFSAATAPP